MVVPVKTQERDMNEHTPAVFDRANPCSKVELQNCFFKRGAYVSRRLVEAQTIIGVNAPKFLMRQGYAVLQTERGVDYYALTKEGRDWLSTGILRYLELHPERAIDCVELPLGYKASKGAKAPQKPAKELHSSTVIRRRVRG